MHQEICSENYDAVSISYCVIISIEHSIESKTSTAILNEKTKQHSIELLEIAN